MEESDASNLEEAPSPAFRVKAATVDTLARTGFPLAFVLFNVLYWLLYTRMDNIVPTT